MSDVLRSASRIVGFLRKLNEETLTAGNSNYGRKFGLISIQ